MKETTTRNWAILVDSVTKGGKVFDYLRSQHIHFSVFHENGNAKFVYTGTEADHANVLAFAKRA